MRKFVFVLPLLVLLSACMGAEERNPAADLAKEKALKQEVYVPKNDLELKNYNKRQRVADDPTTILWCSVFPTQPGAPIFTFPIVGKLTSGNKRPYSTREVNNIDTARYSPEIPGPDGIHGESGEYRYGFTPGDIYVDFYNLETLCTTEPLVIQREKTTFVLEVDQTMVEAQQKAQEALGRGDATTAWSILRQAINQTQGGN